MNISYIIAAVVFIILSCIFGSRRTNPGARIVIAVTMLITIITALTILTNSRLDSLEQKDVVVESFKISSTVYSIDTVFYRIDTIKEGQNTHINKYTTIADSSNFIDLNKNTTLIHLKDSTFIITINDDGDLEDIKIKSMRIVIDNSDTTNRVYVKALEYIPDTWTAWFIPTIKEWTELHISEKEYKKAYSLYPQLFKKESLDKLQLYYATL